MTRTEWKTEGRSQVMPSIPRHAGTYLSVPRCSHRASVDVQASLRAPAYPARWTRVMQRMSVDDGDDARSLQDLHSSSIHASSPHWLPRRTLECLLLQHAPTLCCRRKSGPRLSRKASRRQAAASQVTSTYLEQCAAGWPARCEHAEVTLPG